MDQPPFRRRREAYGAASGVPDAVITPTPPSAFERPAPGHELRVIPAASGGGRGTCSCGWQSPFMKTRSIQAEFDWHVVVCGQSVPPPAFQPSPEPVNDTVPPFPPRRLHRRK